MLHMKISLLSIYVLKHSITKRKCNRKLLQSIARNSDLLDLYGCHQSFWKLISFSQSPEQTPPPYPILIDWLKFSNLTICTATSSCRQPGQNSWRKRKQSLTRGCVTGPHRMSAAPHFFDGRRLPQWAKCREVDSSRPGHQGDWLVGGWALHS